MKKIISIIIIFIMLFNIIYYIYIPTQSLAALSENYTQTLKVGIEEFPESYKTYLQKLQEIHPNWNFKAYYTGIDWNELTSSLAENKCLKNTVKKRELMDPSMFCICGKTGDVRILLCFCKNCKLLFRSKEFFDRIFSISIFGFIKFSFS